MRDVYFAILVVSLASVGAMLLARSLGRRLSRRASTVLCVVLLAFIVAHVRLVSGQLWVARLLPFSNVIVLGNLLLPTVAALAGLASRLISGNPFRRVVLLLPLVLVCAYGAFAPAWVSPPALLDDRWKAGVCIQTAPATCSPAAAATLLRAHGIDSTESEMARLCLTGERGTSDLGLYRGLTLKAAGTGWKVEAFRTDAAGLRSHPGPAILSVRLDAAPGVDPRYQTLWGWTPGVAHSVVVFGFTRDGEKVDVGDPGVGREHWSARDLGVLWHGEGLRLVRR